MPLGNNRVYNDLRGIPVSSAQLSPSAPTEGKLALFSGNIPVIVETVPKTGAGLPGGANAEQYVVDFGPCIFRLRVYATAFPVTAGNDLTGVITAKAGGADADASVGDATNTNANIGSNNTLITVGAIDADRSLLVYRVVDGTSIAAGASGDCDVIIGA